MIVTQKSLTHVGIKGMRWGVRKSESSGTSHPDHLNVKNIRKKRLHEMSNKEIQDVVTRLNLEKQYKENTASKASKVGKGIFNSTIGKIGSKTVESIATSTGKGVASKVAPIIVTAIVGVIGNIALNKFGVKLF